MTVDAKTAVAGLAAKDIEALGKAIAAASFLDETPGDDRQKLRGEILMRNWGPHGRGWALRPARTPPPALHLTGSLPPLPRSRAH